MRPVAWFGLAASAALFAACSDSAPRASGGPSDSPVGSGAPGSATASTSASGSAASGLRDPVQLSVEVRGPGGRHLASGLGECQHTAEASIYGVPAELWRASFEAGESEDLNAVSLTLWQPKAGGAMQVNLSLRGRGGQRSIATVEGGTISGRATASARREAEAAILSVNGEDADGTPVEVTVRCERVTVPVAEGG